MSKFELRVGQKIAVSPKTKYLYRGPNSYSYIPHDMSVWYPYVKEHNFYFEYVRSRGDVDVCIVRKREES